jgi:hypothetical protein
MSSMQDAYDLYDKELPAINHAIIDVWDGKLQATTDAIASEMYEKSLFEESLILDLQQKTAELKVVVIYYSHCKQLNCYR